MVVVSIRVKADSQYGVIRGTVTDLWVEDGRKLAFVEWDDGTHGTWPWSDLWQDNLAKVSA